MSGERITKLEEARLRASWAGSRGDEAKLLAALASAREVAEALEERMRTACRKACGWRSEVVDGEVVRTDMHSPECADGRAALARFWAQVER